MSAALLKVAAACRLGIWPSPANVLAMLAEADADPVESRDLVRKYAASLPEPSSESAILLALRSVSIGDGG